MKLFNLKFLTVSVLFLLCFAAGYSQAGKAAYMQGEQLRRQKKCGEAIVKYQEAEKLEAKNYRYSFAKGKCYYKMKNFDAAISAFEETIEKNTEYTLAYSLIAKIYTYKKDYPKAVGYYDEAYRYESNGAKKVQYKLLIVQMLLKEKNYSAAMSHINDAKGVDPNNLNILYYDAKLNNMEGNYNIAKTSMITATAQLKDSPPAKSAKFYYELGYAYNNLGDYENAKKAWEKANFGSYKRLIAQQLSKNSPGFFYKMAVSYYTASEFQRSREQIDKALELQSDYTPAFILMGKIARKQGNYSVAISNFQKAASVEKDSRRKLKYQMYAVGMQVNAGDFSGALSTSSLILGANPGNKTIQYYKAISQYKLGQYSGSISTLEQLLNSPSLNSKSKAKFSFALGMAAKNNSDTEKAKNAFRNAMYGPYKPAAKNELDKLLGGNG